MKFKIFLAQPYDLANIDFINYNINTFKNLFATNQAISIIYSKFKTEERVYSTEMNKKECLKIVQKSYKLISKCDFLVVDLSYPTNFPIGVFFEINFAKSIDIPVYIICNNADITKRAFMIAYTDRIFPTKEDFCSFMTNTIHDQINQSTNNNS